MFINYLSTIEINDGEDIFYAGYEIRTGRIYYSKKKNGPWFLCEGLAPVSNEVTAERVAYYYALLHHEKIRKQFEDLEYSSAG